MPTTTETTTSAPQEIKVDIDVMMANAAAAVKEFSEGLDSKVETEKSHEQKHELGTFLEDTQAFDHALKNLQEARKLVVKEDVTDENFAAIIDIFKKQSEGQTDSELQAKLQGGIDTIESARESIATKDETYVAATKNYFLNLLGATAADNPDFVANPDKAQADFDAMIQRMHNEAKAYGYLSSYIASRQAK